MTVRVRFAPSPTGYLHVGAARTALFNYLFARSRGGTFILRSDDTDTARSSREYQDDILEHLRWLGLEWDEGIDAGGPHGTYRQSDRYERYADVAHALVREGRAYYSFATSEQLDEFKRRARDAGGSPAYDGSLEPEYNEVSRRLADGETAVIRFRVPRPGVTTFDDGVRGEMRFDHAQVDDFVILRSDGSPTYHLASAVDDVDYGITHVIRGEDLLSSTPKHILLAQALEEEPAEYAHLSLLMGPDGRKLSKRHGDTALGAYREGGFLPEAIVNYLALLGWSVSEGEEDVASLDEMVERFDLSAVSKNPAEFNTQKLEWLNGVYIRAMDDEAFTEATLPRVEEALGRRLDDRDRARYEAAVPLVKERTKVLTDVPDQVRFLFEPISEYDEASWIKVMEQVEAPIALDGAVDALSDLDEWTTQGIDDALRGMLAEHDLSARKGLQPIRVAVSGSTVSPPLFESLEILGRDESLARIAAARSRLT